MWRILTLHTHMRRAATGPGVSGTRAARWLPAANVLRAFGREPLTGEDCGPGRAGMVLYVDDPERQKRKRAPRYVFPDKQAACRSPRIQEPYPRDPPGIRPTASAACLRRSRGGCRVVAEMFDVSLRSQVWETGRRFDPLRSGNGRLLTGSRVAASRACQ